MYKDSNKVIIAAFICLFIINSSCKKFVDVQPARELIESTDLFLTDQGAISAVSGLYAQMRTQNLYLSNGGMTLYSGLAADEIINTASNSTADAFKLNSLLPTTNTVTNNFWNHSYTNIYNINAVLEGLDASTTLTDSVKTQLKGEMKFMRAFYYFYLVNLFGDVPLILNTDYAANASKGRSATGIVYQQITTDLLDAQAQLKPGYPSSMKARPNRWVATALLARAYLFQNDWVNAELQSGLVINSGQYNLVADLNNVFSSTSAETIWQLLSDNSNTVEGATFIPTSATARPTYALTTSLQGAFEINDLRKSSWSKINTVGSTPYYYPYKYKIKPLTPVSEYYVVFRLAEQYLINAEAKARRDDITGAQNTLNMVRSRANLTGTSAANGPDIVTAVQQERRIELFSEWGHRWLDLKRTGQASNVLAPLKGATWQSTDVLFPIPQAQLNLNPFLEQNLGY